MPTLDGLKQGKSPGARFRHAVAQGNANYGGPLKIVGTVNAYCALKIGRAHV